MQAVQALDLGDYTMAVSLLKRALQELNRTMALLDPKLTGHSRALHEYEEYARPRLFDLREIYLRVISECREEIARQAGSQADSEES